MLLEKLLFLLLHEILNIFIPLKIKILYQKIRNRNVNNRQGCLTIEYIKAVHIESLFMNANIFTYSFFQKKTINQMRKGFT